MGGLIETRDELLVNTPQKYTALMVSDDKAHYSPDSAWFATKLTAAEQMAVAQGRYLDKVFTDRQEVLDVIEKAILLFREQENLAAQKHMKGGATC